MYYYVLVLNSLRIVRECQDLCMSTILPPIREQNGTYHIYYIAGVKVTRNHTVGDEGQLEFIITHNNIGFAVQKYNYCGHSRNPCGYSLYFIFIIK